MWDTGRKQCRGDTESRRHDVTIRQRHPMTRCQQTATQSPSSRTNLLRRFYHLFGTCSTGTPSVNITIKSVSKVSLLRIYIGLKYDTSNVLYVLVLWKQPSFKHRCLKLSVLRIRSRRSSLSEFQAAGPATENARRPYELKLCRGTTR